MGTSSSRVGSIQWDLNRLSQESGLSCPQIEEFYSDYVKSSGRDGVMNMKKFFQLYSNLLIVQSESNRTKRDKANHIFRVFDRDHNGILSFDEFLNAIVMINYGMPKHDCIDFFIQENNDYSYER